MPETVVEDNLHAAEPAVPEVVVSEPVVSEVVTPKASKDVEPEPSSPSLIHHLCGLDYVSSVLFGKHTATK